MLHRFSVFGIAIAIMLALATVNATAQELTTRYNVQVDEAHPDFALPRIDTGEAVLLSDFRGKKVLLLHFASW